MRLFGVQFYGQSSGEPVMFGDRSSGKFGAYWVDGGKASAILTRDSFSVESCLAKRAHTVS